MTLGQYLDLALGFWPVLLAALGWAGVCAVAGFVRRTCLTAIELRAYLEAQKHLDANR